MRSVWCVVLVSLMCGSLQCGSTKPVAQKEDVDDVSALMDNPKVSTQARLAQDESLILVPVATEASAWEIDANAQDWPKGSIRSFSGKELMVKGRQFWRNKRDASVKFGIQSDANYLYVWMEVQDDTLIADKESDSITLRLHDPDLLAMKERIPKGFVREVAQMGDLALKWVPGRLDVAVVQGEFDDLSPKQVTQKQRRTKTGWAVEARIALEAFGVVSSLPMTSVAFALEVTDGDDRKRPGPQSVMHLFPNKAGDQGPQFAQVELDGVLPHHEAKTPDGLAGGVLGFWQFEEDAWSYVPLDVASKIWRPKHDDEELQESLRQGKDKLLAKQCAQSTHDLNVLQSFASLNEKYRMALLMCAAREVGSTCPKEAQSKVLLVKLKRDAQAWQVRRGVEVFDSPLVQCARSAPPSKGDEPSQVRDQFSMLPLDFLDQNMWAIGWRGRSQMKRYSEETRAVTFSTLMPRSSKAGFLSSVFPYVLRSNEREQTLMTSTFYFVELDQKKGLDLCEVERQELRDCERFETECTTRPRGIFSQTQVKMWMPKQKVLADALNPQHKRCLYDFAGKPVEGYILLHAGRRLGLIEMTQ